MAKPIHNNCPGYDAEHGIDLSPEYLAELDARASMQVDGRLPRVPVIRNQRRHDARCMVLLTLAGVLMVLCWSGVLRSEESEPRYPGESRAWMGEKMVARMEASHGN